MGIIKEPIYVFLLPGKDWQGVRNIVESFTNSHYEGDFVQIAHVGNAVGMGGLYEVRVYRDPTVKYRVRVVGSQVWIPSVLDALHLVETFVRERGEPFRVYRADILPDRWKRVRARTVGLKGKMRFRVHGEDDV